MALPNTNTKQNHWEITVEQQHPARARSDAACVTLHSILAVSFLVALGSGLRMAAIGGAHPGLSVFSLHLVGATLVVFAGLAYATYRPRQPYLPAIALLLAAGASGAMLYFKPVALPGLTLHSVHQYAVWALLAYVVLHVAAQAAFGALRARARRPAS
jgi:hypothetical protein